MDDILSELDNAVRSKVRCVGALAEEYGADTEGMFRAAFDHPASAVQVSAALRKRGFIVSDKVISRHRNGRCTCE